VTHPSDPPGATETPAAPEKSGAPAASYRALLDVPSLARALAGMQTARIAQSMVGLAAVLFTLQRYHSPELAGLVTFAAIAPGIVVSPIAGALLDRHGRTRLITLDFIVAAAAMVLIGLLALADALPAWLLILIAALSALTGPLSAVGLRSLFPLMAPRHLWERMNALDANGYVVAQIIGPPIAAVLVSTIGGPWALIVLGAVYAAAAVIVRGVVEPAVQFATSSGRLLVDAWQGVVYTLRNPTLRGIAASLTLSNVGGGIATIALPLIVLNRLGLGEAAIGILYAMQGVVGLVSGVYAGRLDTRGRERGLIVWPMFGYVLGNALLLPSLGLPLVAAALLFMGVINGPMDVALFTLRQRRTDPAWMGRAFAVSMNLNFAGFPIGSAIGGFLAAQSIELAIAVAVAFALAGAILSAALIPARAPAAASGT
jgi:MFS family permease